MSLFQTAFFLISVSGRCSNKPPVELTAVQAAHLRSARLGHAFPREAQQKAPHKFNPCKAQLLSRVGICQFSRTHFLNFFGAFFVLTTKKESLKYFQHSSSVSVLAQALCVLNFRNGNNCIDPSGTYTVRPQGLVLLAKPKNILLIEERSRGTLQTCWICLYVVQENGLKSAPA